MDLPGLVRQASAWLVPSLLPIPNSVPVNELRVFISSTFRDLQEEREHLVKKIFPEIRALCRDRGITFTEVDLRWGLTDEEGTLGRIVRTCLEEIDRCRPYFIGITGERYGYVPDVVEIYKDAELLKKYPWIEDASMQGASIIDLEFRHAALNAHADDSHANSGAEARDGGALFFFRRARYGDMGTVDKNERDALERLQIRVRDAGLPVWEFRDSASLGELVYDELRRILDRDFLDAVPPTELQQERMRHEAFAASRRRAYIPNTEYLNELNTWLQDDTSLPLVLYAESGSGKSSLVSFWCQQLRRRHPDLFVVEHYVGIGAGDADHLGIIRHVMEEIKERCERTEEIPTSADELERSFANWLGYTVGRRMLLVIDGINQLSGHALELHWLPPVMPPGVDLIITSTVEQTLVDLRQRGWYELAMQPLKEREREGVIVRYLSEFHKALSTDQVERISEDMKCAHPLFLRTLLEELRLDSSHERLDERITAYLRTSGTEDLFQRVLERMEDDYSTRSVRDVMTLLWCSRDGLNEDDLQAMTGLSRLKLATMIGGLDYHLVRKNGLLTFFHDYLRRAVEKRYLGALRARQERYRLLADFFEAAEPTLRSTHETLHALSELADQQGLYRVLSSVDRFPELWKASQTDVLQYWATTETSAIIATYRTAVDRWQEQERSPDRRLVVFRSVAGLFYRLRAWSEAETWYGDAERIASQLADPSTLAAINTIRGSIEYHRGNYDNALDRFDACEIVARELNDIRTLTECVATRAHIYVERGMFDKAMECALEQNRIAVESGDRVLIARALGAIGDVHNARGEYKEALEWLERKLAMVTELGDRLNAGITDSNRGIALANLGDYPQAMECFNRLEDIARQLGDQVALSTAIGNRGRVLESQGDYQSAMACFIRQEEIARELGDRSTLCRAVGSKGMMYHENGESAKALECYNEQEAIARELESPLQLAHAIGNRGAALMGVGEYEAALACFAEQESIARTLGRLQVIGLAIGNRGVVHARRGEFEFAMQCFVEAEEYSVAAGSQHDIANAIGNRGTMFRTQGNYDQALACFFDAIERHRRLGTPQYLAAWLSNSARCLLNLADAGGEMPQNLADYIAEPGADSSDTNANWRAAALRKARVQAEECHTLARALSNSERAFDARFLLASITAAEGDVPTGISHMQDILRECDGRASSLLLDEQRADLHYALWKLGATDDDHRTSAIQLYQSLLARAPSFEYRERIEELTAET